MIQCYYSPLNKYYFVEEKEIICEDCNKPHNTIFYVVDWCKKRFEQKFICPLCIKKVKEYGQVIEKKLVICSDILPDDCIPIFLKPPTICDSNSNYNVYNLATKQIGTEKTIDDAKQSRNKDFMKEKGFIPFDEKILLKHDKTILLDEAIEKVKNSKIIGKDLEVIKNGI